MSGTVVKRTDNGTPALAYKAGGSAYLTFGSPATGKGKDKYTSSPAEHNAGSGSYDEELGAYTGHWVPWGVGDDHPRKVALMMRKSTVGRAGLQRITKTIYGQRLFTYKIVGYDGESNPQIEHLAIPDWEAITRRSNFDMVRLALAQDYAYFGINFPEIRFNGNKEKVWGIDYHKATHTRLDIIDPNTGYIPFVYISARFPQVKKEDCQSLPVIDMIRYPDQLDSIRSNYKDFKYVMPQFWPDVLNDYYPEVYWYSAKDHIEIASAIPGYKKEMFRKNISIKYHIEVPFDYFYERYPTFKQMTEEDQDVIIEELYNEIIECLSGAEKNGNAILSFYSTKDGKDYGRWSIKMIEDKIKNDLWLPDEAASGSQIQFAMMLNPALSGQGNTGGDYGGGANNGGSNIRESGLDVRSMVQADRDIVNGFFKFCRDYNGWDPEAQIGTQDMVLTTLDTGGGTKKVLS